MLGAIVGDIVGSVYEFHNYRGLDFPLFTPRSTFTDDSVLTFATAKVLLDGLEYAATYQDFARRYPNRRYGGFFYHWIYAEHPQPYNSFGNGSAMRVSPIGFAFESMEETLADAQRSAEVTHNHPEGIKGAQAVALAIYLARHAASKAQIRQEISSRFGYNLSRTSEQIRQVNRHDETCPGSVPEAIIAFLESTDFEHAIRLAISLGGDSDTIACMAGGIAQAFYGSVPQEIATETLARLPEEFVQILERFNTKYLPNNANSV